MKYSVILTVRTRLQEKSMKDLVEYIQSVSTELDDIARSCGELVGGEVEIGNIYKMEGSPHDDTEIVLEVLTTK